MTGDFVLASFICFGRRWIRRLGGIILSCCLRVLMLMGRGRFVMRSLRLVWIIWMGDYLGRGSGDDWMSKTIKYFVLNFENIWLWVRNFFFLLMLIFWCATILKYWVWRLVFLFWHQRCYSFKKISFCFGQEFSIYLKRPARCYTSLSWYYVLNPLLENHNTWPKLIRANYM